MGKYWPMATIHFGMTSNGKKLPPNIINGKTMADVTTEADFSVGISKQTNNIILPKTKPASINQPIMIRSLLIFRFNKSSPNTPMTKAINTYTNILAISFPFKY